MAQELGYKNVYKFLTTSTNLGMQNFLEGVKYQVNKSLLPHIKHKKLIYKSIQSGGRVFGKQK